MNRTQRAIKRNARFNQELYRAEKNEALSQASYGFNRDSVKKNLRRAVDGEKDARVVARNSKLQTRNYLAEVVEA